MLYSQINALFNEAVEQNENGSFKHLRTSGK